MTEIKISEEEYQELRQWRDRYERNQLERYERKEREAKERENDERTLRVGMVVAGTIALLMILFLLVVAWVFNLILGALLTLLVAGLAWGFTADQLSN